MTSQEKIEWLSRYQKKDREISRLLDERASWMERATNISPVYSDMPKAAPNESKIQMAIEKAIELEQEADERIDELIKIKEEIKSAISTLLSEESREVLEMEYLERMKYGEISKRFGCSRHKIYNIHDKAIEELFS